MTDERRDTDPAPAPASDRPALHALADDGFVSDAGRIDNLKHHGLTGSVSVLYSRAGSTRASHYHKTDWHMLYVVEGEVHYYERAIGDTERPTVQIFTQGEMFYTPPMREHLLYFAADTVMVSLSNKTRSHEEHEKDVVRVSFAGQ